MTGTGALDTSNSQLMERDGGESDNSEDIIAGTDAGGEDGSDIDIPIEPETESEFPAEVEVEGLLEDSDNDGDNA